MEESQLIKEVVRQARLTESQKHRLASLPTEREQQAYRIQCLLATVKKVESDFRRTVKSNDGRHSEATHRRMRKLVTAAIELGGAVGLDYDSFHRFLFSGWSAHIPDLQRIRREHLRMIRDPIFAKDLSILALAVRSFRQDLRCARISEHLSLASLSEHVLIILSAARNMASITSYSRELFERQLVESAHGRLNR